MLQGFTTKLMLMQAGPKGNLGRITYDSSKRLEFETYLPAIGVFLRAVGVKFTASLSGPRMCFIRGNKFEGIYNAGYGIISCHCI